MDTDISHAVEERLAAIEARLDALEGTTPVEPEVPPEEEVTPVDATTEVASTYSSRSKKTT